MYFLPQRRDWVELSELAANASPSWPQRRLACIICSQAWREEQGLSKCSLLLLDSSVLPTLALKLALAYSS